MSNWRICFRLDKLTNSKIILMKIKVPQSHWETMCKWCYVIANIGQQFEDTFNVVIIISCCFWWQFRTSKIQFSIKRWYLSIHVTLINFNSVVTSFGKCTKIDLIFKTFPYNINVTNVIIFLNELLEAKK